MLLIRGFCGIGVLLVLWPMSLYLTRPWKFRRDRLFGDMNGDPVVFYYLQFRPGVHPKNVTEPSPPFHKNANGDYFDKPTTDAYMASFRADFHTWYGRKYYIAPLTMLLLLTVLSAWWAQRMLMDWAMNPAGPGTSLRALAAAALAGAFVWVVSDETDRLRRRDFTTSDVYYYVFRILLAIPFAWAISAVQDDQNRIFGVPAAIPLAFFLGAFPTTTLFTIARRFATQQLKLGDDQQTGSELEKLQTVTKTNAERFQDEGIYTISQLAYADPVDLTIRTNFDFSYVVDCVSQSLAWIYLGDKCATLSAYSLRGAQEIVSLIDDAANTGNSDQCDRANKTIDAAADCAKVDRNAFRSALLQIALDPYTRFLVNVWD